jgi:hypothetical protein
MGEHEGKQCPGARKQFTGVCRKDEPGCYFCPEPGKINIGKLVNGSDEEKNSSDQNINDNDPDQCVIVFPEKDFSCFCFFKHSHT